MSFRCCNQFWLFRFIVLILCSTVLLTVLESRLSFSLSILFSVIVICESYYKSDLKVKYTVLLKQKKQPDLDITGFFFRISTHVKAEVLKRETKSIINLYRIYYYASRPLPEYSCWKRTPLYPILTASVFSVVSFITRQEAFKTEKNIMF